MEAGAVDGGRCVLVVDDDQGVRETFAYVLEREGYSVRIAATAAEALAYVELDRPDAILLDLKMPLINGAGFLFRLRKDPANQNIAVAVITAAPVVDEATVNDLRGLRAQVWHKPLSIEEIQQIVSTLMADTPPGTRPIREQPQTEEEAGPPAPRAGDGRPEGLTTARPSGARR